MIFIFEGVDASGKTYLANEFSKNFGFPVIKKRFDLLNLDKDKLRDSEIEKITHFFFESIFPIGKKYDIILDRSLLSSLVFSKFFNRDYNLDYIYKYFLDEEFSKYIKCFFIYAPHNILVEHLNIRDEKFFSLEEIKLLQEQYQNIIQFLWIKGCTNIYKFINDVEGPVEFFDYLDENKLI